MRDQSLVAWHAQEVKDVFQSLASKREGLSRSEAKDRHEAQGSNRLPSKPPKSVWNIVLAQFASPFMAILIFAGLVSAVLGEILDMGVIAAAVLINVVLGFVEEYKADQSLEALKQFLPEEVHVRRDGKVVKILSTEVVTGDLLLINTGDKITADGRLVFENTFQTNEAALTGESTPVKKSVDAVKVGTSVADQTSMVFAGTVATSGRAEVVVTGIGTDTELGRISTLVSEIRDEKTPLQQQLSSFARSLGLVVLVLAGVIFTVGVLRGFAAGEMFYISVALAVAAVPEGLIVAVTVVLAIGMQRILKKKALVRRLVAAETLGSVSVICVDKTGTLTTGVMAVDELRIGLDVVDIENTSEEAQRLREDVILTSAAVVELNEQTGEEAITGTATDVAMLRHARDFVDRPDVTVVSELPFNSKNKFAAVSYKRGKRFVIAAVGAPDVLLKRCDISDADHQRADKVLQEMAGRGLRVLFVARAGDVPVHKHLSNAMVQDLDLVGFLGLRDPLRPEAAETIDLARRAGLHPVMVTGDHPKTASVIASEAGLDVSAGHVMTGAELDELSDDQLIEVVQDINVFARVVPKHKLRIVRAWQRLGRPVAMTGDGVNDAPAIKAADIGVAFGSGTSVAKETADMVLLDNNFKTIVDAVREGRIIFDNLRKMIVYLLADSFSEIVVVLGSIILGLPLPILPAQILWINLIADGLPAIALTFEPGEDEIMNEPPRRKKEPILNTEMVLLIFLIGLTSDAVLFGIFWYLNGQGLPIEEIRTLIYVALGSNSLFYVFAVRKFRRSIFRSNPFENRSLLGAVVIGFLLLLLPLWIPPVSRAFDFTSLTLVEWGVILALALGQLIMIELVKELYNHRRERRKKA